MEVIIAVTVLVCSLLIMDMRRRNRREKAQKKKWVANEATMLEMFKDADSHAELLERLEARKEFFKNWKTADYRFLIWALAQIQLKEIEGQINRRKSPFYQYIEKS